MLLFGEINLEEKIMSDYYDVLSEGGYYTADLTEDQFNTKQELAYEKYEAGEVPSYSKGICDSVTAGYGRLDDYGYWEYPLIVDQFTLEIEV